MHTATRLAVQLIEPVRRLNPGVHVCFYGLYAPMNESYLRELGVETILGGEFEEGLSNLIERLRAASANAETKSFPGAGLRARSAGGPGGDGGGERRWQPEPVISLARLQFAVPDRSGLVPLQQSAHPILPGGVFVTSAVESLDNAVLERLDKGHTRADFLAVVELFRQAGLVLQPTFVPFTPWTTLGSYCDLLDVLGEEQLIENVAPIQLAIRLLIPAGSRLLELAEVSEMVGPFDQAALVYPWRHPDPGVDALCEEVQELVRVGDKLGRSRAQSFARIWRAASAAASAAGAPEQRPEPVLLARAAIPYLNEPWYC